MATYLNIRLALMWALLIFVGGSGVSVSAKDGRNAGVSMSAEQQAERTVTVRIYDDTGPIAGAAALVKNTGNGAVSDLDGVIVLKNVPSNSTLVISMLGYTTREVRIGNRTDISVTLWEDTITLQESVAVGYGLQDKRMITGAVASLDAGDLMHGVGGADITTALQGKIPGLVMYNNGSTNATSTIQLRGLTSINAGSEPLIVIDGFAGGDLRSLSQDEIESIDVLKDASAAAIYGTRAASGVILVTTKSGINTQGKLRLTYSNELSIKQDYNAPEMLSASEYVALGLGPDYGSNVNWWKELLNRNNFSHKHNLSVDFGTEKAQVYTTFYYAKDDGLAKYDTREDYGGRLNARFVFFNGWLEIQPVVNYRQTKRNDNYPSFLVAMRANPTRSPYDSSDLSGYNNWDSDGYDYNTLADSALEQYDGTETWLNAQVNLKLNIKPVEGLSYQQFVAYNRNTWELYDYFPSTHRTMNTSNIAGKATISNEKTYTKSTEGYFSYDRIFKSKHSLSVVLGYSYEEVNGESYSMTNQDFATDSPGVWDIGTGSYLAAGKASMSSYKDITERLFAGFARVNYSYDDRYLISGSIRYEGSSKFAKNNRWGTFWAVSGGWRISSEKFMKNVAWIDDLKIRGGYGVTGNNSFSSSYTAALLKSSGTRWMMPDGSWDYSYAKSNTVNSDLGWEEKREWDVGLDFSFFGGRLYGTFDYYRRKIVGMIYLVDTAQPPAIQRQQYENIGTMESKGFEITIGGDIIRSKGGFRWTSDLNMNHYTGKILTLWGNQTYYTANSLPSPLNAGTTARIDEGAVIGAFNLYKSAGIKDGHYMVYNADGEIIDAQDATIDDKQYIGNYIPKLIIGWSNMLSYKNFDLGINFRSWLGYDIYNAIPQYFGIVENTGSFNALKSYSTKYKDKINGISVVNDMFLENGSFLKIDAITLGYTLPMARYTKNFIQSFRFYFTVGNVCTITGYSGMDPEVDITGWDGGVEKFWSGYYPNARTYTLGMQFKF